jgi:MFS family permease
VTGGATESDAHQRNGESRLRWWMLALAAIAVSSSYYEDDVIGPIADLLQRQRGFGQSQLGMLNGVISIPNVALALINGLLIDRYGPARVAFWSAAIGVLGAALTAVGSPYELMVVGRFIFGVSEGAIFIALIAALIFYWLDRRHRPGLHAAGGVVERINWAQVLKFDRSYWYILALHVLYAAVFFPFRTTYAIEYFQHAKGLSLSQAGVANSWVFFAAIFATPFFGLLADRFGHRALMLIFGTLLLPLTFVVLGLTGLSLWVSTVMMGVSFSLVPAVIWPATTLIVEPRRLGTALGLITLIQALGMAASNLAAGWLADKAGAGAQNPGGYALMLWFFFLLSLIALFSAVLLWRRETGPDGHGLEDARVRAKPGGIHPVPAPS